MAIDVAPDLTMGASAPQDSQPRRLEQAQLSFKEWIENKAAAPATMVLIVSLVLRSAQTWSFGAFSLTMLPHWLQLVFDAITGVGAALSMELLMSAAGAQWWRRLNDAVLLQFDTAKPKKQRDAEAGHMKIEAGVYFGFTILGALASITGSVIFAVTATHNANLGALVADVALAVVITAGVFFFGVIYEPRRPDVSRKVQDAADVRVNEQALDIAGMLTTGQAKPEHIAFLKGVVSPQTARKLDALMPRAEGMEYWDTPKIMRWLGLDTDAAARDIRRKLQKAQTVPALGVRRKSVGAGLEAPESALFSIFRADIERAMQRGTLGTLNGQSAASQRDPDGDGETGAGQPAGNRRRSRASRPQEPWWQTLVDNSEWPAPSAPAESSETE